MRRSHLPQKKIQTLQSLFEVCRWPSFSHPGHRIAASSSSISQVGFKGHMSLWAASRHVLLVVHELLPVHVLLVVIHVLPGLPHRICGKKTLRINVGKPKRTNMINSDDPFTSGVSVLNSCLFVKTHFGEFVGSTVLDPLLLSTFPYLAT